MFAGFCVYAYYKFVRLDEAPPAEPKPDSEIPPPACCPNAPPDRPPQPTTTTRLREYNAYLAELAKTDKEDTE